MSFIGSAPTGTVFNPLYVQFDVRLRDKPSFRCDRAQSTKNVIVPATSALPAIVRMASKIYFNTSDKLLNMGTSGRNGLDVGTVAATTVYYLYAIPPANANDLFFDLVASRVGPLEGPYGYPIWSYLGSFCTSSGSTVPSFISIGGFYQSNDVIQTVSQTGSTAITAKSLTMPVTAYATHGFYEMSGTSPGSAGFLIGYNDNGKNWGFSHEVNNIGVRGQLTLFLASAGTIYLVVNNAANQMAYSALGWLENIKDYV